MYDSETQLARLSTSREGVNKNLAHGLRRSITWRLSFGEVHGIPKLKESGRERVTDELTFLVVKCLRPSLLFDKLDIGSSR